MSKLIPILFSTAMVKALLEGRKTMTRRKVKFPLKSKTHHISIGEGPDAPPVEWCPLGKVGDIVWVRETFISGYKMEEGSFVYDEAGETIPKTWYRADNVNFNWYDGTSDFPLDNVPWKPSIHMPFTAARIFLKITEIRVERLNNITDKDAIAEGIDWFSQEVGMPRYKDYTADASGYGHPDHDYPTVGVPACSFSTLWESINGIDSWEANPWVWVIVFERCEKPISDNRKY